MHRRPDAALFLTLLALVPSCVALVTAASDEAHPHHHDGHIKVTSGHAAVSAVFDGGSRQQHNMRGTADRHRQARHEQTKGPGVVSAAVYPPNSGLAWRESPVTAEMHPPAPRAAKEFKAVPPAVADELGGHEWLEDLRDRERDADSAHAHFVDATNVVSEHAGEGKELRTKVAYKMEELKARNDKLKELALEEKHLAETRDALKAKIQKVMNKKLNFANARLKRVQQALNETESKFEKLNTTHEEARAQAMEMLKEKKEAKKALKKANKDLAEVQKTQQEAAKAFFNARLESGKEVQAYHVLVTELKGASTALTEQKARTKRMKKSVKRLQSILDMEMGKLEKAFKFGEQRLQNKYKRAEESINTTQTEMNEGKDAFKKWQDKQKERKEEKEKMKLAYNKEAEDYRHKRQDVLEGAWQKAGAKASAKYGSSEPDWAWNDWTWNGPDEGEAVLADASLDEKSEEASKEEAKEDKEEGKEAAAEEGAEGGEQAEGEAAAEEEGAAEGEEGGAEEADETADKAEAEAEAAEEVAEAPAGSS